MDERHIDVGRRKVGRGLPIFVVAELAGNHGGNLERALEMIDAAHRSGADAVKLQTFTADSMTLDSNRADFRLADGQTIHEMYARFETPWEWHSSLRDHARDLGLELFSTPFSPDAVDHLELMDSPMIKIASFEIVDLPLIRHAASTGRPLAISTGMSTLSEIEDAVTTAREYGSGGVILLKCTSTYPAVPEEMNLRTIPHLAQAFGVQVGLSDHSTGIAVPVAATALGITMIEKHFTLSRADGGPESGFALEPAEFKAMVEAVRVAEQALGTVHYGLTAKEQDTRMFRRSLYVVRDIAAGETLSTENVRSIRPGHGLAPKELDRIVGRSAAEDICAGTPLSWDLVS